METRKFAFEIQIETTRKMTKEERARFREHVEAAITYASKRWIAAEMTENGCWCSGFDHVRSCPKWVLPY